MITFVALLLILLLGYIFYGRLAEKAFGPDDRKTPAIEINDGVDYVPMKTWKAVLIELLNIAGTGPIFGALMGACFGPVVFLWIVFGAIIGGAVHDYMSGMISERNHGASIAQLSGIFMGRGVRWIMRVFTVILLTLTGTVFIISPAALLAKLIPGNLSETLWSVIIILYYIVATLLPIDKIIGKLYPVFGVILMIMAVSIAGGMIFLPQFTIPEMSFENIHPSDLPIWPFMFVTVACGAVSGFHSTQSPMMAKCIKSEKVGRKVFYGAMILESVIALVWAAAGMAFYGNTADLSAAISTLGQSGTVYEISTGMLGKAGGALAIIGVVVCPITTGDTAFRSARLIIAEWIHYKQDDLKHRLVITIPLLAVGVILTRLDYNVLWRYFSWSNQTLAAISLWVASVYLIHFAKNKFYSLMTALPAMFMSSVSVTYILMADEGLGLSSGFSYPVGIIFSLVLGMQYAYFLLGKPSKRKK